MGGIFSSEEKPATTPFHGSPSSTSYQSSRQTESRTFYNPPTTSYYRQTQQVPTYQTPSSNYNRTYSATLSTRTRVDEVTNNFARLSTGGQRLSLIPPEVSKKNPQLFDINDSSPVVQFTMLLPHDPEYLLIKNKVTNKRNVIIDSIEKVENPYLEKAYELKKAQKKKEFSSIEERLLFHGTKKEHINAICRENFNWRLCKTHKFGRGVSFSPNSTYASAYRDDLVYNKVMLVAKVMVGRSCIGSPGLSLPPAGYDTTRKDEGIVIVKFEDNEFYPVYKINYHVTSESVGKNSKKQGGKVKNTHQNDFSYRFENAHSYHYEYSYGDDGYDDDYSSDHDDDYSYDY